MKGSLIILGEYYCCDYKLLNDPKLIDLVTNARHYGISIIFQMQDYRTLSYKNNFDYVFLGDNTLSKQQLRLYNSYSGFFDNKSTFFDILDKYTKNYSFLVLDLSLNNYSQYKPNYSYEKVDFKIFTKGDN